MTAQVLSRRERKKQAVRDRICAETISLLRRQGLENATVEAISEATDIAKKTFYNYFSSRNELLLDICNEHILSPTEALIDEALKIEGPFSQQLAYVVEGIKKNYTRADLFQRELIDFMVTYFSTQRAHGISNIEFMNRCYSRLFEENISSLKPGLTPSFCAQATVALMIGVTINWLNMDGYDVEASLDETLSFLLGSMLK